MRLEGSSFDGCWEIVLQTTRRRRRRKKPAQQRSVCAVARERTNQPTTKVKKQVRPKRHYIRYNSSTAAAAAGEEGGGGKTGKKEVGRPCPTFPLDVFYSSQNLLFLYYAPIFSAPLRSDSSRIHRRAPPLFTNCYATENKITLKMAMGHFLIHHHQVRLSDVFFQPEKK